MNTSRRKIFLKYLIIACVVALTNILFFDNKFLSAIIVILEVIILLYKFLQHRYVDYIVYYVIFMANCLEYGAFVGAEDFYNFKTFSIAGVGIGVYLLIPLFFSIFKGGKIKFKGSYIITFAKRLLILNIMAMVVGLILIMVNDNNILGLGGTTYSFIAEIYTMMFFPIAFTFGFLGIIQRESENVYKIGLALQATLWGNVFQILSSLILGISGSYGYIDTLQVSILYFLLPFTMVLYFCKKEVMFPKLTFFVGLVGSATVLIYNANGKLILLFCIMTILFIFLAFKNNDFFSKIISLVTILIILFGLTTIISKLSSNPLYNSKLQEVLGLLNVFQENWVKNLPQSSRVRVEEFRNVIIEFSKKPWLIITGKGYLGSIKDYTGYISNLYSHEGLSSEAEWIHKTFFNLHEITGFILMYGAAGIIFTISFLKVVVRLLIKENNIWILIGAYWFVLYYGYSFTIGTFGIIALLYGICQARNINS